MLVVDDEGRTAGTLLGGAVDREVLAAVREVLRSGAAGHPLVAVPVSERDAVGAGLTCGGAVELLVQRIDAISPVLWDRIAAGRPVALVTALPAGGAPAAAPVVLAPGGERTGSLGDPDLDDLAAATAEPVLRRPGAAVERRTAGATEVVVEAWNAVPHLVVVGSGELATALDRQVRLLGWTSTAVDGAPAALAAVERMTATDVRRGGRPRPGGRHAGPRGRAARERRLRRGPRVAAHPGRPP